MKVSETFGNFRLFVDRLYNVYLWFRASDVVLGNLLHELVFLAGKHSKNYAKNNRRNFQKLSERFGKIRKQ